MTSQVQVPGVHDYYGYDVEARRLVHVRAHHQLVLGRDATKNYRLPIEQPYLASSLREGGCRVPAPEFEFVFSVIRMALKHLAWDAILLGQDDLSAEEHRELATLAARINQAEVHEILAEHLRYVNEAVFGACLQALEPRSSRWFRMQAGRRLRKSLRACERHPEIAAAWLGLWRQFASSIRARVSGRTARGRFVGGGLLIGVVGGDGAGKSTQIAALDRWLSERFDISLFHFGRPRWSVLTVATRGMLKIGCMLGLYSFIERNEELTPGTGVIGATLYPSLLRAACTARDRYLTYAAARRLVNSGAVVVCDRYPLPGLIPMDGPQVVRWVGSLQDKWLIRKLAALEERYYCRIARPDMLVVLRGDPDICASRKSAEEAPSARARCNQVWTFDWRQTPAYVIDADRPQAEVCAELQDLVWSKL